MKLYNKAYFFWRSFCFHRDFRLAFSKDAEEYLVLHTVHTFKCQINGGPDKQGGQNKRGSEFE